MSTLVQRITGLTDEQHFDYLTQATRIPMCEVCAAKDIAAAVLFVAGPAAARLTGAVFPVDGFVWNWGSAHQAADEVGTAGLLILTWHFMLVVSIIICYLLPTYFISFVCVT